MGKGSSPRPRQVSEGDYAANYDRIFRKPPAKEPPVPDSKDPRQLPLPLEAP